MIKYNLREDKYKNHPLDDKYGVVIVGNYAGFPVTIVDNHNETKNNRYTNESAICLLHLSENVREYVHLRLFKEFLYLGFSFNEPKYRMYDYKYQTLSNEEVIKTLKNVFYNIQPNLQDHSLVGCSSKRLEDDPNYYQGYYVLNNEEEYTILKCVNKYKFYKGKKTYYPDWKEGNDLIFEDNINFDLYKSAIEVQNLRMNMVRNINMVLDKFIDADIQRYYDLKDRLEYDIKIELEKQ